MDESRKIRQLEQRVTRLERQMEQLVRYLKRAEDEDVQRAARRARAA